MFHIVAEKLGIFGRLTITSPSPHVIHTVHWTKIRNTKYSHLFYMLPRSFNSTEYPVPSSSSQKIIPVIACEALLSQTGATAKLKRFVE